MCSSVSLRVWEPQNSSIWELWISRNTLFTRVTVKIQAEMQEFLVEFQFWGEISVNLVVILIILKTFIRANRFPFFLPPPVFINEASLTHLKPSRWAFCLHSWSVAPTPPSTKPSLNLDSAQTFPLTLGTFYYQIRSLVHDRGNFDISQCLDTF